MKVLFILKKQGLYSNYGYNLDGYNVAGSGLYNSALFSSEMLKSELNIDSELIIVLDNNEIDKWVTKFRPDVVIIEAIWVTPSKFPVLIALHPRVIWVVRNHSALPFLAHQGNSVKWLLQYALIGNVLNGHNDQQTRLAFDDLTGVSGVYLPNYYPTKNALAKRRYKDRPTINIGCFGAIRQLKNQLIQGVAAIRYANHHGKNLIFHINTTRVEGGTSVINNLRETFDNFPQHELREHPWLDRVDFLPLMRNMDLHMQVSMSETFNMVTADAVVSGVPVVVSKSIPWVRPEFRASTTNCTDIINRMHQALKSKRPYDNLVNLRHSSDEAVAAWDDALSGV